ncbi:MAG: hypothetical protein JKY48_05785 [Flavobacteriales bacterium]|nr:hypothetical protein [Flavobacteriales bacterium]
MLEQQVSTLRDPANSNWVIQFEVTSRTLHWPAKSGYYIRASYELQPGHPSGEIMIGSSTSLGGTVSWGEGQKIESNAANNSLFQHINDEDLSKIWWVKLTFDGEDMIYRRYIYYSFADVYSGNSINDSSELFPEREHKEYKNRINTGVCFSGGGTRALVMGMGQMRYLQQFQDKIGYFSSVSGGSWASSIYAYSTESDVETLLGKAVNPEDYQSQLGAEKAPTMCVGAQKGWFSLWTIINIVRMVPYFMYQFKNQIDMDPTTSSDFQKMFDRIAELDKKYKLDLKITPNRFWIDTVGLNFFMMNGMYKPLTENRDLFTLDENSLNTILEGNALASLSKVVTKDSFRTLNVTNGYPPYLIMNSLMLRPESSLNNIIFNFIHKKGGHIGYEYTPLYQGAAFNAQTKLANQFVGGGNTAMHAYGSNASAAVKDNKILVMSQGSIPSASLAVASGTSSSAFAGVTSSIGALKNTEEILGDLIEMGTKALEYFLHKDSNQLESVQLEQMSQGDSVFQNVNSELFNVAKITVPSILRFFGTLGRGLYSAAPTLTPEANYFTPRVNSNIPKNVDWLFGDAGLSDNFGLMAMLRRKVKNIIVFINTSAPLEFEEIDGVSQLKNITGEVPAFFNKQEEGGYITNFIGSELEGMQVFKEDDFDALVSKWKTCLDNDKPLIAETTFSIVENEKWTVPGNWKTKVLWVYNSMTTSWSDGLSAEVKAVVEQDNFPYVSTGKSTVLGLSVDQITMLSNLSYWTTKEAEKTIKQMLKA